MVVSTGLACLVLLSLGTTEEPAPTFQVAPSTSLLRGSDSLAQIVATGRDPGGSPVDLTGSSRYESRDPKVAVVDPDGLIRPTGDGRTTVEVSNEGRLATIAVVVSDFANARGVHFVGEVVPILSKYGCNAGGCHGKASGQNGFRLSLLGFDPKSDYEALVKEGRGRRVFPPSHPPPASCSRSRRPRSPTAAARSSPSGRPNTTRSPAGSARGCRSASGKEPELVRLAVEPPRERSSLANGRQQVRVVAHYGDGTSERRHPTGPVPVERRRPCRGRFPKGVIRALDGVGEAAIMARFGGLVGRRPGHDPERSRCLAEMGRTPVRQLRRSHWSSASSESWAWPRPKPAPTPSSPADRRSISAGSAQARRGGRLRAGRPTRKRSKWVDRLLDRPEYADLLRDEVVGDPQEQARARRDLASRGRSPSTAGFANPSPRTSLTTNSSPRSSPPGATRTVNPPVVWYRQVQHGRGAGRRRRPALPRPRLQCARCHHHPFEKWSQDDYYGFASLFSRVGTKPGLDATSPRIYTLPAGLATNPLTGEPLASPNPGGSPDLADLGPVRDPRVSLVAWLKSPTTRSSPGPWSTATGSISWVGGWSSPRTT